jgi:hypothetical protein
VAAQAPSGVQMGSAFGSAVEHAFPQLPQLSTVWRLKHPPSHEASPASHSGSIASSAGPVSPAASVPASGVVAVVESPASRPKAPSPMLASTEASQPAQSPSVE